MSRVAGPVGVGTAGRDGSGRPDDPFLVVALHGADFGACADTQSALAGLTRFGCSVRTGSKGSRAL